MKRLISLMLFISLCTFSGFAQNNNNVDLSDEIYQIIEIAQLKGLCGYIQGTKPYTQKQVLKAIDEILSNEENLFETEKTFLQEYKDNLTTPKEVKNNLLHFRIKNKTTEQPFSFNYDFGLETSASGGVYNLLERSQWGFDIIPVFNFNGDFSKYVSYEITGFFDLTRMPLYHIADDYFVGYAWYEKGQNGENIVGDYLDGKFQGDGVTPLVEPRRRTVKFFQNNSYLPYSYTKKWSGQMYLLSNMTASGLEGWPQSVGISGGILGEVNLSLFDDRFIMSMGRFNREWAAMDTGSSLVLNAKAHPFMALNFQFNILPFVKYSSLIGGLEYPNQDYINEASWPEKLYSSDDAKLFQNAYAINMIELDFKYFHFDFGSSTVFPKRFEIGYMFPLINMVEYQNHIGDYDNTAMFGDIKVKIPEYGSIWASLYLDEINGLNNNPFTSTRAMYAGQLGTKILFPWLPFANISMRYTKIEPYCYTHHAINYTPWYNHYIIENYTNNGESLGYYLPPNSDEFFFKFEAKPKANLNTSLQYQFIRHGAEYGSQQVPGSSLYSELSPYNRDELNKYFLRDGAYNWMHIISVSANIQNKKSKVPFMLYGTAGFMYSYYTMIDSDIYNKRHEYGNNGNSGADSKTVYHFVNTDEYPVQFGGVLSLGIKLFYW